MIKSHSFVSAVLQLFSYGEILLGISSSDVWESEAISHQRNFFSYAEFYSSLNCLKFLNENHICLYAYDLKTCLLNLLQNINCWQNILLSYSIPAS